MICSKCGTKVAENSKFCSKCGSPLLIDNVSEKASNVNRNPKNSAFKWVIIAGVVGVATIVVCLASLVNSFVSQKNAESAALSFIDENYCSTFGDKVDSIEKNDYNHYTISYNINQEKDLWKTIGTVKMSVSKVDGDWIVDVEEEKIECSFANNDNWYHITASGNREFLVKMISFNNDKVTLEYYGYDMGNYGGSDDFDHETTNCDLKYDGENRCFVFAFMGDWRINGSNIGYNQFEVGAHYEYYQSSGEFNTLKPVNPDDYWWYEKAKRQTGDYDSSSSVDILNASVGDIISFGKFEMDNDTANGYDDISWLVIDENDSGILVISKYCLTCQETSGDGYNTWENSVARKWLNDTFYKDVFTAEERRKIKKATITNADNPDTGIDGGNDTSDYLFLLSIDEVNKYFPTKEDRKAYGTLYLQDLIDENDETVNWWLRTPGKRSVSLGERLIYQSYVGSNGFVYTEGSSTTVYNGGLRPAMWLSK